MIVPLIWFQATTQGTSSENTILAKNDRSGRAPKVSPIESEGKIEFERDDEKQGDYRAPQEQDEDRSNLQNTPSQIAQQAGGPNSGNAIANRVTSKLPKSRSQSMARPVKRFGAFRKCGRDKSANFQVEDSILP